MSDSIFNKADKIIRNLPEGVTLEAACKMRTPAEIQQAVDAGVKVLGENYVQEAEEAYSRLEGKVRWHLIGHLQRNKVKRAVKIFDMVESLDSYKLAKVLNKRCLAADREMDCLVEVNSGREKHKYGFLPEEVMPFIKKTGSLKAIKIRGLMTMGPALGSPEEYRPYFRLTRELFEEIKTQDFEGVSMEILSMGMSDSYKIAVEEGASLVRIGTAIFGPRG